MDVSLPSLSWRTGLSTRSNVQLLMLGRNLNTGFSIGTAYCSSPMRMHLASQVKHRPRQPQLPQMPPWRLFSAGTSLLVKLPSLVTQQGGDMTSQVWLNGKFRTKPWTQMVPKATQSPPDLIEDEVSEPESEFSDSEPEGT